MYKIRNTVGSIFSNKVGIVSDDDKIEVFVVNDSWSTKDVAKHIVRNTKDSVEKNRSFTILNIKYLIDQVNKWNSWMPRVKPFYAVKCSNSDIVLEVLASLDVNFDCASLNEIKQVLSVGVKPHRVIFAHTTKPHSSLKYAKSNNIDLLTFDSDIELLKIKQCHPSSRLLIRIRSDALTAVNLLGNKFGCCANSEAPLLLKIARDLQLNVVGVCFHVGSLCNETEAYIRGIRMAKELFKYGSELGHNMKIVDIGGGFPGDSDTNMMAMAEAINSALDEYFPPDESTEIIAEPGRFFVSSAFTLACLVHSAKRPISMVQGTNVACPENGSHCANVVRDRENQTNFTNGNSSNDAYSTASNIQNLSSTIENTNHNDETASNENGGLDVENGSDKDESLETNGCTNKNDTDNGTLIGCDEIYKAIKEFSDKTDSHQSSSGIMYYMDNGIYASFAGVLWKRLHLQPEPLHSLQGPTLECSLWGPTCDGKDMICSRVYLPALPIPSWLFFPQFGAYTCTTSTNFNGYTKPLQYTFIQRNLKTYLQNLNHNATRNKIKWTEITQNIPSYHDTAEEDDIPSHLPFDQLHNALNETKQEEDFRKVTDVLEKPNQHTQTTHSSLFFKNSQMKNGPTSYQKICDQITETLSYSNPPFNSISSPSHLMQQRWNGNNASPNSVAFGNMKISNDTTPPNPFVTLITETIGNVEDFFSATESSDSNAGGCASPGICTDEKETEKEETNGHQNPDEGNNMSAQD